MRIELTQAIIHDYQILWEIRPSISHVFIFSNVSLE